MTFIHVKESIPPCAVSFDQLKKRVKEHGCEISRWTVTSISYMNVEIPFTSKT
jgi:hypothetical protein